MSLIFAKLHAAFHEPDTRIYRVVQGTVWSLIVLSIVSLAAEALLPDGSPAEPIVQQFDRVILAIFALEIVLRVSTYRPPSLEVFRRPPIGRLRVHLLARLGYVCRPLMLVDILAVLALFPGLRGLRALRLLRLMRTTRVFRYRNPFAIVMQAARGSGPGVSFEDGIGGSDLRERRYCLRSGHASYPEARARASVEAWRRWRG